MASSNAGNRGIWGAIIMLAALVVGGAAGALFYACGGQAPAALQVGGGAFLGMAALGIALYNFVTG